MLLTVQEGSTLPSLLPQAFVMNQKKIAIITLHGMGETKCDYADELKERLKQALGKEIWSDIYFKSIFYQEELQNRQQSLLDKMPTGVVYRFLWKRLRRFMLHAFSDAATLEHRASEKGSPYDETQLTIRRALDSARKNLTSTNQPVVIIAHSLGGQVISNYIWDSKKGKKVWCHHPLEEMSQDEVDFLKLKTARLMLTTGCNIPLFVSGFRKIVAFDRPNPQFAWWNYYDKDDVLGWPLKPLSCSYEELVNDVQINAGGLFSWTPLSHGGYWNKSRFPMIAAQHIRAIHAELEGITTGL